MKFAHIYIRIILLLSLVFSCTSKIYSRSHTETLVLHRIFEYRNNVDTTIYGKTSNVYVKYRFQTDKRNFTLLCVPTMYAIGRGKREYIGETYNRIFFKNVDNYEFDRQLSVGTIPHHRMSMPNMLKFLTPTVYNITLIDGHILSPFNRQNRIYYKYIVSFLFNGKIKILFKPKVANTQFVSGSAIVDYETGRIISTEVKGEYDMIAFKLDITLGEDGIKSLLPARCDISAKFVFMGNKLKSWYTSIYNVNTNLSDSLQDSHDRQLMDSIRPEKLTNYEQYLYSSNDSLQAKKDTLSKFKKESKWRKVFWDALGNHLVNRVRAHFNEDKGYFKISPLLNPLYLGYSHRKGLTYKFDFRGSYDFTPNRELSFRFKSGYSFKQNQFYFNFPIKFNYNKRRNGYVELEIGNGNRITNSSIVNLIKAESLDSIDWDKMRLDYFKDFYLELTDNYDISSKWSVKGGFVFHKRSAVDKTGFIIANRPYIYHSFAPMLEVQFRPSGWDGPILTSDYERGIKGIGNSNIGYERLEFDFSYLWKLDRLRALSLRAGNGFYTSSIKKSYFLDYSNFRENNIPNDWNDDWTGEFQLLNSNWYNSSKYYVRTNTTYESPLLLLSWVPLIGKYIEMERFYVSTLFVNKLHPYVEVGYGFTNRLFSMGIFLASRNQHYYGFGCRFGLEIFNKW